MASSDPTDHALAAIASIRDNAEDAALQPQSEAEKQAMTKALDAAREATPEQLKVQTEMEDQLYKSRRACGSSPA